MRGEQVLFLTEGRAQRIPTPPTMHNDGYYTASISEMVRWLGEKAEELGVNILPGFPVDSLLVDGKTVRGVRTTPRGPGAQRRARAPATSRPPTSPPAPWSSPRARAGRSRRPTCEWQGIGSENPQIYALGVKEVWETKVPLDRVIHTLGWPLPRDAFGGSFMYPLGPQPGRPRPRGRDGLPADAPSTSTSCSSA